MNDFLLPTGGAGSLPDRVYAGIVESILRGDCGETGRLPTEAELAARFGVSRPTVREALSRLRSDGIVASRRGAGSYVVRTPGSAPAPSTTPIRSMADIERYYAFRTCVEAGAAAGAAEFRDAADIDAIRAGYEALGEAMEAGRSGVDEDVRFHLAIAGASHNPFFVQTIATSVGPIRQFMELARSVADKKDIGRVREVQREHRAIVEAIERRAPTEAAEAMRAHILAARHRIFESTPLR